MGAEARVKPSKSDSPARTLSLFVWADLCCASGLCRELFVVGVLWGC